MDHTELETDANATAPAPQAHDQVAARRRFLKGTTLALPAVMTLHSVAAQATARSSLVCAGGMPGGGAHLIEAHHSDDYARELVDCYDELREVLNSRGKSFNPKRFQPTNNVKYFGDHSESNTVIYRNIADGVEVASADLWRVNCPQNPNVKPSTCQPKQMKAMCFYDPDNGALVGLGCKTPPTGSIMMSASGACFASIYGVRM